MADVPLSDVPMDVLFEQVVYPNFKGMVGNRFRIAHLKSARGQTMNGKVCIVTGFDRDQGDCRLHCRILDAQDSNSSGTTGSSGAKDSVEGTSVKLKGINLIPEVLGNTLAHFMEQTPPIPDNELLPKLEQAIGKHSGGRPTDRADLAHRLDLYRSLRDKLKLRDQQPAAASAAGSSSLSDKDYCFPCGAGAEMLHGGDVNFAVVMNTMKPACYGNEVMDIRHIDIGLQGDGHTECSICTEALKTGTEAILVTLPCMHIFHEKCIVQWLESDLGARNWHCPLCRDKVPEDMSTYRVAYEEQLQRRIDEFPLSGFCTKCIISIMERNRNQSLGGDPAM
jgi:hypothetical protein